MERLSFSFLDVAVGNDGNVGLEKRPLSESELLLLAQRYFLSPLVVKEAYNVFERYCTMEEQKRQQRLRMMKMITTRSARSTVMAGSCTTPIVGDKEYKLSVNPSMSNENKDEAGEDLKTNEKNGDTATKGVTTEEFTALTCETGVTVVEEEKKSMEKEEGTLGVEGLLQLLNDLGLGMSFQEVSDMVQNLNIDPIDFVLRQRAIEAAAAAAAAPLPKISNTKQGHVKKAAKTGSARGKGGNDDISNDKHVPLDTVTDVNSKGGSMLQNTTERVQKDAVTFSNFLFILSHMPVEQERNMDSRDFEVCDLFNVVDVDKDGLISVGDLQTVVKQLIEEGALADDRDIRRLSEMSKEELKAVLMECDIDNDGHVTLEDLRGVLLP